MKFLAEKANACWLIDAIASYQPQAQAKARFRDFQIWELFVEGSKGRLVGSVDTDKVLFEQVISYTDFPLPHIKLYCARGEEGMVLMLTSEY